MDEPQRPPELTAAKAAKSPLFKKLKGLYDFKPDQVAIDEATAVGEEAFRAELKRQLGVKS